MKYDYPEDAPKAIAHTLLISCPNNGGLVSVHKGMIDIIDHVDSIGLHVSESLFIRGYQTAHRAYLDIFSPAGLRTLALNEVEDLHDILVHNERLYVVSTGTNEVLVYDLNGHLLERISRPGEEDAWHLNCISPLHENLAVSAFGTFSRHREWAGGRSADRGIVIPLRDLSGTTPLLDHLNQPHSHRLHHGALYCCDSSNGSLVRLRDGQRETLHLARGFTRGLALCGDLAYLGLSASREPHMSLGQGEIAIIDLVTFSLRDVVPIPFKEIYDIVVVTEAQLDTVSRHYDRAPASRLSKRLDASDLHTRIEEVAAKQAMHAQIQILTHQIDVLGDKIRRQTNSASWKLTAPLRALRRLVQRTLPNRNHELSY